MNKHYLITGTIAAAAAALALSACSSSGSPSSQSSMPHDSSMSGRPAGSATVHAGAPASGPHNAADVAFATDMIPHHAQAVEMAKMALSKASNPKVKQLARVIDNAQAPEISAMSGWLTGWNKPLPDTSMGGMHMGGTSMPGMISDTEMAKLGAATGAAFDTLFLSQMVNHHTGALTMANTELADGQNSDVRTLAKSIIIGQSKEITQMKALLPTIK